MRQAKAADAAAIAELTRQAYAKWIELIGREPLPMQVDYAEALMRHRFDLIEREGLLVGLIETVADGDHLLIANLAVAPAAQGQGYGARLLTRAERLARAASLSGLRLYTNKRFEENVRFLPAPGLSDRTRSAA